MMSPFSSILLLLLVSNAASHSGTGGPHIVDVNILLPPKMTHPVEYMLQGTKGCFIWSWYHHDILSVLPVHNSSNHCSTSARLKSIAPYSGRKETDVYATDVQSGFVIRCRVSIDKFARIQILHSCLKLEIDRLASLCVRAFDSEGNIFSSLVGIRFMWNLVPEPEGSGHHLVHVPLKLSPLGDIGDDIQIGLKDSGAFSDRFVVKGTEIGAERISVHLLEPMFGHMADSIVLTVTEATSVYPAPVVTQVELVNASKELITNAPLSVEGYRFLLKTSGSAGWTTHVIPYDCEVNPSYIGYANPWLDYDTGRLYCIFFPYSVQNLIQLIGKSRDMRQDTSISIKASVRGATSVSGFAFAQFIGGFAIVEMDHDVLQLNLTRQSKAVITVVGNIDVKIYCNHSLITPIHIENHVLAGRAIFEVGGCSYKSFKDKLIFSLAATGQKVVIDVTCVGSGFVVYGIGLATAILGLVLRHFDSRDPTSGPSTIKAQSPTTPPCSSTIVANQQSPQVPQAFMDYVKGTVNETPYQRDLRRRLSTQ